MARTVTLGAVGDIAFSQELGRAVAEHGFKWPFARLQRHLDRADLLIGNMESITLPPDFPAREIDPRGLVSTFDATPALKAAGFALVSLANNHALDGGTLGLLHTQRIIEELGIAAIGAGKTQRAARRLRVLERGGIRLGFLAYGEDMNWVLSARGPSHAYYRLPAVLADVRAARKLVDVLVVMIHADLEFMETPSVPRRSAARRIAAAGAALVLEGHPHVPQGVEMVDGCLIAYSLGNCFFHAHSSSYMKDHGPHTAHSFLLLAEVSKKGVQSFERVPFAIGEPPEERPAAMTGQARAEMLAYLTELDRKCQDDAAVARNWREISVRHLELYLERILKGYYPKEALVEDLLGRLLLVQENTLWVQEVAAMLRENWRKRALKADPYHRPMYYFSKKYGY